MISALRFNGRSLPNKIGITSFTVSTPDMDFKTVNILERRGLIRTARKFGNRAIQFSIVLMGNSYQENLRLIRELCNWCYSPAPAQMFLPGMNSSYILCECEVYPPIDIAKTGNEFMITFRAHDPAFIDVAESRANVGSTFNISGSMPVFPTITCTASKTLSQPAWTLDSKTYIKLARTVYSGSVIVIDCEHDRVTIDGSSADEYVTVGSTTGWLLQPGAHYITGQNDASGIVTWHNANLWGA